MAASPSFQIEQLMLQITVDTDVEILSRNAKERLWELANSSVADKDTWDYYTEIVSYVVYLVLNIYLFYTDFMEFSFSPF